MSKNKFPKGWDEKRIKEVLAFYENQSEDEAIAEDEAAFASSGDAMMQIPFELVPVVRSLIAQHQH